jgi:hypothetical protein
MGDMTIVALVTGLVGSLATYLVMLRRTQTDVLLDDRSDSRAARQELHTVLQSELVNCRAERDAKDREIIRQDAEIERLWNQLRDSVETGERAVVLAEVRCEVEP